MNEPRMNRSMNLCDRNKFDRAAHPTHAGVALEFGSNLVSNFVENIVPEKNIYEEAAPGRSITEQ